MIKKKRNIGSQNNFFNETQKAISNRLHFVTMLVAIPACTFSGIRLFTIGFKPLFLLDVLFALVAAITYFFRAKIHYRLRMLFLLTYLFLIGVFSLQTFGLIGFGMLIIFTVSVILTVLFGFRYGLVALFFSLVTVSFYLYAFYMHWITFDYSFDSIAYNGYHLLTRGIFFASYLIAVTLIVGFINRSFEMAYQRLGISESRLNLAISSVEEVVLDFDLVNQNYFVSNQFEEVVKITSKDKIQSLKDWLVRVHPYDRKMLLEKIRNHVSNKSPDIWAEYRFKDSYGQWQWLLSRAKIVERNGNGFPLRVVGTLSNITHSKKLREELVEIENRYRTLFLMANDPILIVGRKGVIKDANIKAAKIFGYTFDTIIGLNISELCSKTDSSSIRFSELFRTDIGIIPTNRYELTMLLDRTVPFPVEASIATINDLGQSFHQVVIHDLTLQRRFELEKFNAIAEIEERERQRLAANLHDDVGPLLASINMYLSLMANHKGNQDELVANMQDILRDAISSVREISYNLSPDNLIFAGLATALTRHFLRFQDVIKIHFSHNLDNRRLPTVVEVNCYRVVKELLNNTIKYANAKNIYISLFIDNTNLNLRYSDDGVGFDFENKLKESKGIGLVNILERLKALKATYKFYSEPFKGFSFEMNVNTLE